MTTTEILALLHAVRRSGNAWIACCPAHEDGHASLSISAGADKRTLLYCHAGCSTDAVCRALSIEAKDLFAKPEEGALSPSRPRLVQSNGQRIGLTVERYSAAKQLPLDVLQGLGVTDITYMGAPAVRFPYLELDGHEACVQIRLRLDGDDRFRWRTGDKPMPYGLSRLAAARDANRIAIVEGASDAQTLWYNDIPALGIPGAASWRPAWDRYLDGIARIEVVIEPDAGGDAVQRWLERVSFHDRVWLVRLDGVKDPSALYLQDPQVFRERWLATTANAVPWRQLTEARNCAKARELYDTAKDLLLDPQLVDRVGAAMRAGGYAGDLIAPTLAYIVMTSRVLSRPMNCAFIAPSSAGKNRSVDAATELMPADAIYVVRAGSARALIYNDEQFEHRIVIFAEADSIPEDGPAASAVRSIASDSVMAYEVVEKNATTGKFETRRIEKTGPTVLITTSTQSLGTQLSTRVLEVPVHGEFQNP